MTQAWGRMLDGWRLHIVHETGFAYDGEARGSYNEARLSPATLDTQSVLGAELRIEPVNGRYPYVDYWGNRVIAFQIDEPHRDLKVTAEATVETSAGAVPTSPFTRADLVDAGLLDLLDEYLIQTDRTLLPEEAVRAITSSTGSLDLHETAAAISEHVRSLLVYTPGATGVQTSAAEALHVGHGVCQDFTHLTLGLLRGSGIPARYVSGYLHPEPDAQVGQTSLGESHAWVEYFAGDWYPIDPTSGSLVGPRHVVIARGRDYSDAAPLKGIYHGAPATALGVTVTVTRLA